MGKPEAKKSLGRPKHRWKDNINMDPEDVKRGACTGLLCFRIGVGGRLF
jgi:hypothetical protein